MIITLSLLQARGKKRGRVNVNGQLISESRPFLSKSSLYKQQLRSSSCALNNSLFHQTCKYFTILQKQIVIYPLEFGHHCIQRRGTDQHIMNSMKTCSSVMFYFITNSFSDVSRKWILLNMIRVVRNRENPPSDNIKKKSYS